MITVKCCMYVWYVWILIVLWYVILLECLVSTQKETNSTWHFHYQSNYTHPVILRKEREREAVLVYTITPDLHVLVSSCSFTEDAETILHCCLSVTLCLDQRGKRYTVYKDKQYTIYCMYMYIYATPLLIATDVQLVPYSHCILALLNHLHWY